MNDDNLINGETCNTITCYRDTPCCITNDVLIRSSYVTCDNSAAGNRSDELVEAALEIRSDTEAEKFLELVNWDIFTYYPCLNKTDSASANTSYLVSECRSNESNDWGDINVCLIEGGCFEKDTPLIGFLSSFVSLFFIYGFFTLLGNSYVIVKKTKFVTVGTKRYDKEKTIFNVLILNLALADIFMGICVTMFAIDTAMQKSKLNQHYVEISLCNAIGITGLLSNQVSVSVLALISGLRLYGVLQPFKQVKFRFIVRILLTVWVVWIITSLIPLFELTGSFFYVGVRNTRGGIVDISFVSINKLIGNLKQNSSGYCQAVLGVVQKYNSPKILLKTLEKLRIVGAEERHFIGAYNKHHLICLANPLVEFEDPAAAVLIMLLLYNLLAFSFVGAAYTIIFKKMKNWSRGIRELIMCTKTISNNSDPPQIGTDRRQHENRRMYRIILFIVGSDFCLWIPIIIVSLVYFGISATPHECIQDSRKQGSLHSLYSSFSVFLIITLPLNSAINPYFYSVTAWKKLIKKFKVRSFNRGR